MWHTYNHSSFIKLNEPITNISKLAHRRNSILILYNIPYTYVFNFKKKLHNQLKKVFSKETYSSIRLYFSHLISFIYTYMSISFKAARTVLLDLRSNISENFNSPTKKSSKYPRTLSEKLYKLAELVISYLNSSLKKFLWSLNLGLVIKISSSAYEFHTAILRKNKLAVLIGSLKKISAENTHDLRLFSHLIREEYYSIYKNESRNQSYLRFFIGMLLKILSFVYDIAYATSACALRAQLLFIRRMLEMLVLPIITASGRVPLKKLVTDLKINENSRPSLFELLDYNTVKILFLNDLHFAGEFLTGEKGNCSEIAFITSEKSNFTDIAATIKRAKYLEECIKLEEETGSSENFKKTKFLLFKVGLSIIYFKYFLLIHLTLLSIRLLLSYFIWLTIRAMKLLNDTFWSELDSYVAKKKRRFSYFYSYIYATAYNFARALQSRTLGPKIILYTTLLILSVEKLLNSPGIRPFIDYITSKEFIEILQEAFIMYCKAAVIITPEVIKTIFEYWLYVLYLIAMSAVYVILEHSNFVLSVIYTAFALSLDILLAAVPFKNEVSDFIYTLNNQIEVFSRFKVLKEDVFANKISQVIAIIFSFWFTPIAACAFSIAWTILLLLLSVTWPLVLAFVFIYFLLLSAKLLICTFVWLFKLKPWLFFVKPAMLILNYISFFVLYNFPTNAVAVLLLLPLVLLIASTLAFLFIGHKWLKFTINTLSVFVALIVSIIAKFAINYNDCVVYNPGYKIKILSRDYDWASIIIDKKSILFSCMVVTIFTFCLAYSCNYLEKDTKRGKFLMFLSLFTTSMLIIFFSNCIITVYLGWELIGFSSFFLIAYYSNKPSTFKSALKAMMLNKISDALFLGLIIVYLKTYNTANIVEASSIAVTAGTGTIVLNISNYSVMAILIALMSFIKSAQIFFNSWLLDSMDAPVPASALIHSATLVVAGIYITLRLKFIFDLCPTITSCLVLLCAMSAAVASFAACFQTDLKRFLACSTIANCGIMFAMIFLCEEFKLLVFAYSHGILKSLSFLMCGYLFAVNKHKQDVRYLGSLNSYSFLTLTALTILILSSIPGTASFDIKHSASVFASVCQENGSFYSTALDSLLHINSTLSVSYGLIFFNRLLYLGNVQKNQKNFTNQPDNSVDNKRLVELCLVYFTVVILFTLTYVFCLKNGLIILVHDTYNSYYTSQKATSVLNKLYYVSIVVVYVIIDRFIIKKPGPESIIVALTVIATILLS